MSESQSVNEEKGSVAPSVDIPKDSSESAGQARGIVDTALSKFGPIYLSRLEHRKDNLIHNIAAALTTERERCDNFYEGVRLDFMRALAREQLAIGKMIAAGLIKDSDEWFECFDAEAKRGRE